MKKLILAALCCLVLTGCYDSAYVTAVRDIRAPSCMPSADTDVPVLQDKSYVPHNYERQKSIWLSYIDLAPMLSAETESGFELCFDKACKNVAELGINTIYVHVRPFGDAMYDSQLFPPSELLNGDYDPLEVMCRKGHEYGLSVHAWINPLRLQNGDRLSQLDGYKTAEWYASRDDRVTAVEGDEHLWLDPAYADVRELIADGAAEIAQNYDIDGIHYDDYFYPTTDESFDALCFSEMGGSSGLSDWRCENISDMCREIYESVKSVDKRIEVGISPQGNIENNYDLLYADVRRWCSEKGFCDRIIPQIYFGYDDPVKPFSETLGEWREMCSCDDVGLVVGLAAYKIGTEEEFTANTGIIASQINDCEKCSGTAIYAYSSLFGDENDRITSEREAIKTAFENY